MFIIQRTRMISESMFTTNSEEVNDTTVVKHEKSAKMRPPGPRTLAGILLLVIFLGLIAVLAGLRSGSGAIVSHIPVRLMEITSDSMYPMLKKGDCILIREQDFDSLEEGDVITFYHNGTLITHEIVSKNADGSINAKGTANQLTEDGITGSDYVGTFICRLPGYGQLQNLLGTWQGKMMIGILVLAFVLGPEILGSIYDRIGKKRQ